jgi:AcrR family transcriptional regulator
LETKEEYMSQEKNLTKGKRTEQLLKDAAVELLSQHGYHDLKVTDVARQAGLSAGVFYIYFKSKDELVGIVFDELIKTGVKSIFEQPASEDPFEAILQANRKYVSLMYDRGGLTRAMFQILDQLPAAREKWRLSNSRVAHKIAAAMERRSPGSVVSKNARVFTALAAQAMLDSMILNAFAFDDPDTKEISSDPERFAQALSILWYRILFGQSPSAEKCPAAIDFFPAKL